MRVERLADVVDLDQPESADGPGFTPLQHPPVPWGTGATLNRGLENMGCIELDEKAAWRVSSDLAAALPDLR